MLSANRKSFPETGVSAFHEKAGLRRDTVRSQVIDALEAQEIKETGLLIPSDYNSYFRNDRRTSSAGWHIWG